MRSVADAYARLSLPLPLTKGGLLVVALALAAGCDSGLRTAPVRGVVSFRGAAVPEGTVSFYPVTGGRPATGRIRTDGRYELSTFGRGDGAIPGEYKVAIEAKRVVGSVPAPKSLKEEIAQEGTSAPARSTVLWLLPEEYSSAESSSLTATVRSGQNEIDFDLP